MSVAYSAAAAATPLHQYTSRMAAAEQVAACGHTQALKWIRESRWRGVPLRHPWADVIHPRVLDVGEGVIERVHCTACVCHVIIVFTVAPLGPGRCWRS